MGLFGKAKSNPEATFKSAIDAAVRAAKKAGVGRRAIANILEAHGASISRILSAEREQRHYGTAPIHKSGNIPD